MRVQLRIVGDDGQVLNEDEILRLDKGDDRLEAISLSLDEAKDVLAGTQERLVTAQAASLLARYRCYKSCARPLRSKGRCRILFRTIFGTIPLASAALDGALQFQAGAVTAGAVLAMDGRAASGPQRVNLRIGRLLVGGYARIADQHHSTTVS
jgi:hypothetical protein